MHASNQCPIRPMPPRYGEFRHRRRPAASSKYYFLRLGRYRIEYSAGRNSSKASGSRAGERGLPIADFIAALPDVTILRYTNPLIESQRLMYSSRSLRTWSAVYGPSLELNDCQPVCR